MSQALRNGVSLSLLCLWLTACGGSQTPPAETPKAPEPLALPDDPIKLLPASSQHLVRVDLAGLRRTPYWEKALSWMRRGCVEPDRFAWLLDDTDEVAGAYRDAEDADFEGVAVLEGGYRELDAAGLIPELARTAGRPAPTVTTEQRGRFQVHQAEGLAVSRLSATLLVLGDPRGVAAVLDVADGKAAPLTAGPEAAALAKALAMGSQNLSLLMADDPQARKKRLQQELGQGGAQMVPAGAAEASVLGLSLGLAEGLELHAGAVTASPEAAQSLIREAQGGLWQADLLLKLAGLPAVLSRTTTEARGNMALIQLRLSAAELELLTTRVEGFLGEMEMPECMQ